MIVASKKLTRSMETQAADLDRLGRLIECGLLEPEEQTRAEEIRTNLHAMMRRLKDVTLSDRERAWVDRHLRLTGLTHAKRSFAESGIPEGRRVDHLDGVPGAFRKPLRPPPLRRAT